MVKENICRKNLQKRVTYIIFNIFKLPVYGSEITS